ncbi:hypothetical protein LFL96_29670 [Paraburkholderia sp. D15]|uniref:hypothetical protein n=1 Tax=Paraburkholderia sp. D15 TaxID=2880218 RepID=UPI00247ACA96|nr:hypothetical protein [Paraburkholderia sp. D15]WGS52367.1 hypothetical protein LFL96_29670 [Paraburkholderia sp. D15]WKF62231.1 hypothetical protein HUO10_006764 [Paraburkholderia busanensis]
MSKLTKLFKTVYNATKTPDYPEDHTWSPSSMAQQRALGAAEAEKLAANRETVEREGAALPGNAVA